MRRRMSLIRPEYHPLDRVPKQDVLALVTFGGGMAGNDLLSFDVPIPQIGPPIAEVWRAKGEVVRETRGGIDIARTDDVLFGTIRARGRSDETAFDVYESIVEVCRGSGYANLWRIWNHVGGINEDEDCLERYKRFSTGRHEALTSHGYSKERFPAASAVGMSEPGLLVYFIAGRQEGLQAENPRQVSAYDYPPQYGPRSPSFSRATVVDGGLIFVSGTASVVGHETRHSGNAVRQLEETIENLDVTIGAAAARIGRTASARDLTVAKIYLRSGVDQRELEPRLREVFSSLLVLQSDICRRELLLEIEGIAILE
jgi:chorismate lyase/3-hydroxybenzoate synthase